MLRITATVVLFSLSIGCEENQGAHTYEKRREIRTQELSAALTRRCALPEEDPTATVLDKELEARFLKACGRSLQPGALARQCVRGSKHWVYCDGTVDSWPREEWGPSWRD